MKPPTYPARILTCDLADLGEKIGVKADLIVADPPYNLSIPYDDYDDQLSPEEYGANVAGWSRAMVRLLAPTGSIWVVVSEEWHPHWRDCMRMQGMAWRNTVIWRYGFGNAQRKKFTPAHACLIHWVRCPKRFTFNADPIRVASKRQTEYNDRRANPKGKVPDDVWDGIDDIWSIDRLAGTHRERVAGVPTQLPEKLVERIVRASSNVGDLVVDPFCGSGTTAAVCQRLERPCVTCDTSSTYTAIARRRVTASKR